MRMRLYLSVIAWAVLGSSALTLAASVTGMVVDTLGVAIPGARVVLPQAAITIFTDSVGRFVYAPASTGTVRSPAKSGISFGINAAHTQLHITLQSAQYVSARVIDLHGRRSAAFTPRHLDAGEHTISLRARRGAQRISIFDLQLDERHYRLPVLAGAAAYDGRLGGQTSSATLNKRLAVDSLIVSKSGYVAMRLAVESYPADFPNIVLRVDRNEWKADSLLRLMTLDEKLGQMVQAEVDKVRLTTKIKDLGLGSVLSANFTHSRAPSEWADVSDAVQAQAAQTRLKIPLIYGVDAVHGHNQSVGATIFPHNVGMGCTRNAALMELAQKATAEEVVGTGCNWTFSPCIAVPRDERWGRTYEGFGETAEVTTLMAAAATRGLQGGATFAQGAIAACAKHYAADGGTVWGTGLYGKIDQGNATCSEALMRAVHLPGYLWAVREGLMTVMNSYSSWNGVDMHNHSMLLTQVLKGEFGFRGFVITDYNGISTIEIPTITNAQQKYNEQVKRAVNAGVDMFMSPGNFDTTITALRTHVQSGAIAQSRIDDAVRRILRVKYQLGLFDRTLVDRAMTAQIGSAAHRDIARQCVQQSLVVLRNEAGRLPLAKQGLTVGVVGSHATNLGWQCGGWTMGWGTGTPTVGTTILKGIKLSVADSTRVHYYASATRAAMDTIDVAIVVTGEQQYAEWFGDNANPSLPSAGKAIIDSCVAVGTPVVLVIISGRPILLEGYESKCAAVVAAWYPGTEGQGVADVLFGTVSPKGKLAHSWPRNSTQIPINYGDATYDPLYAYGYGLTW